MKSVINKNKRFQILVFFFLIIISIIFFFGQQIGSFYRIFTLEKSLKDISLNFQIDGKNYHVINGNPVGNLNSSEKLKVLNLAAFYQWNKEDPLFYSPDLNIDNLNKVINKINIDQEKLLNVIKENEHIYPTDFLKAFVESSVLMRQFINNPTAENANILITKQKKAVYFSNKEALSLSAYIIAREPNTKFGAISLSVKNSIGSVVSDLSKIADNSKILLAEIVKRENCLKGTGGCVRPGFRFDKPTVSHLVEFHPKEQLLDKKLIFDPLATTFINSLVKGPYIAKTPCFGWGDNFTNQDHLFYLKEDPQANILLATDIYFRRIIPWSQSQVERDLIKEGINYVRAPSSKLYSCPYGQDLAEISEMHLFLSQNKPMLSSIKFTDKNDMVLLDNSKKIEKQFFQSKYPSYENAQILSQYYGYIYLLVINDKTYLDSNSPLVDELLRRKLVLSLKLGDFDKILIYTDMSIQNSVNFEKLFSKPRTDFIKTSLYPFRNFYGVMYLPFSSAVFRSSDELTYIDKVKIEGATRLDGPQMLYSQAITKYLAVEINKWILPKKSHDLSN